MKIGERIKKLRVNAGLSQLDVAKAIDSTKQAVYKYENDIVTNIPIDKISKLSVLFGVSPSYIMGWDEQEKPVADNGNELSELDTIVLDLFHKVPEERRGELLVLIESALKMQGLL